MAFGELQLLSGRINGDKFTAKTTNIHLSTAYVYARCHAVSIFMHRENQKLFSNFVIEISLHSSELDESHRLTHLRAPADLLFRTTLEMDKMRLTPTITDNSTLWFFAGCFQMLSLLGTPDNLARACIWCWKFSSTSRIARPDPDWIQLFILLLLWLSFFVLHL